MGTSVGTTWTSRVRDIGSTELSSSALDGVRGYIADLGLAATSSTIDPALQQRLVAAPVTLARSLDPLLDTLRASADGPGGGALREELARLRGELTAIQRDQRLPKPLRARVSQLLHCDAMRVGLGHGSEPPPPRASEVLAGQAARQTSLFSRFDGATLPKLAFGAHVLLSGVVATQAAVDIAGAGGPGWIALATAAGLACARLGWSVADATSYVFHAFFDQVNPDKVTPALRDVALIFQEHHEKPSTILDGTFWDMTGRLTPVSVALLGVTAALDPGYAVGAAMIGFTTGGVLAQHSHKVSHDAQESRGTRLMRKLGLFMSSRSHGIHHARPRNATYATLSGETNALFDRLGVGNAVERLIAKHELGFDAAGTPHWQLEERRAAQGTRHEAERQ